MDEENKVSFSGAKKMWANSTRLFSMLWKEKKKDIIFLLVVIILSSAMPFLRSGAIAWLINALVEGARTSVFSTHIYILLGIVAGISILPPFFYHYLDYKSKLFWFFLEEKFEFLFLEQRARLDVAAQEDPKHNDLFNRINENGKWRIQNFVDRQFYIFQNILEVCIASIVLVSSSWWVFVIVFLGTIPELVSETKYGKEVWSIFQTKAEVKRRYWELERHFEGSSDLIELRLFQNIQYFVERIRELFRNFRNEERKNERARFVLTFFTLIFSQGVVAFAMIWFTLQVIHGNIQIGTFTFLIAATAEFRSALSSLFRNLGRQYQDNLFVGDIFVFLDLNPVIQKPKENAVLLKKNKTPKIEFRNVTFSYPDAKIPSLKNFNLEIYPGEKIAIVGANGAGKTTFVKLLCRFYDPNEGEIYIDGHDLRTIDLDTWYSEMGVLFQDYARYHFLVKEAIALGRSEKEYAFLEIKHAAKASEADKFINAWNQKYEQMLGKQYSDGVEPSVGQWQKLAIARTFYRDPRILILDEPTASIDAESEAKIFEKLESLPKNRSVILISHRFSTVRHATKIAVIEEGELKELGTHEELLLKNKIYAKLFYLQAKGYE